MTENFVVRTWQTTPVITRSMAILSTTFSLLVYINAISPFYLSYSTFYVKKLQLWRIITCFFYFGPINLDTILHIVFMCRYSKMLEEGFLNPSEYFYLLLFCMSFLFSLSLYLKVTVLGSALSSTITYIWTRKNPNTHVQLLGCVIFPAFYLPFVVPIFSFITERKLPIDDMMGILVGHVYYYLKYVYPRFGSDILRTPDIIKRLLGEEVKKVEDRSTNNRTNVENVRDINVDNIDMDVDRNGKADDDSSIVDDNIPEDNTNINAESGSSIEVIDEPSSTEKYNKNYKADDTNSNETSDDSIKLNDQNDCKDVKQSSDTFESVASSDDDVDFEDWNNEDSDNS